MAAKEVCESWNFELFTGDFLQVINYLEAQRELMDAHMVDFFTSNHWESLLPRQIRDDLALLSHEELVSLPTACSHESENFEKFGENLKQFLTEAKNAQLKNFSWLKDIRDFSSKCKVKFIPHIMTPKKSYEVEIMSDVINRLAAQFQASKILDLGSGKGYLSQYLALQYGLKVIGVDSSHSNTQNAIKRNERLLKAWGGLVKKSHNEKGKVANSEQSSLESALTKVGCFSSCNCHGNDSNKETNVLEPISDMDARKGQAGKVLPSKYETNHVEKSTFKPNFPVMHECSTRNYTHKYSSLPSESKQCAIVGGKEVPFDGNELHNEYLCAEIQQEHPKTAVISESKQPHAASQNSFLPVTGFVDQSFIANGELRKLFDKLRSSGEYSSAETNGMFLIGLHTCGDLVPMALRIFVSEPSVKLMCIVGCCYHLVSQEFGSDGSCSSEDPGFPMSQFLKPFRLHVSRNATMVAQQAADRIASQSKFPPPSVLYRAILQVILKEKFGLDGRGMHVGKTGVKCKTFKEYVHKCLIKLGLQERISELSDEEVESYLDRFKSQEAQLHAFHQLRAAIAPCIESVFLMDRLCYLYEQGFKSACIVRLFDPVKSPRCYAIIASRT